MKVRIVKDSMCSATAKRITTFELTYQRFLHAELMTHRVLSRNSASSRAIPTAKLIQRVIDDPAMPCFWGKNQAGMQAAESLDANSIGWCKDTWLRARDEAVESAKKLLALGLHKQIANRVLEPWMQITVLVTATEWSNLRAQRTHKDAQPEFQELAREMFRQMDEASPDVLEPGEWHIPFGESREPGYVPLKTQLKIATGRCARVSYLTHNGTRDEAEDVALHDKLVSADPPHMSPFEHCAQALPTSDPVRNFVGWKQYRTLIPGDTR